MNMIEAIKNAGVVGCGGAGFPTHRKLGGKMEYLIINGAECEPLLRTDRYLMLHEAPALVKAAAALKAELQIPQCVIAVKSHYRREIDALRRAIAKAGAAIRIHQLESFYPAGDEQTITYEVTGRAVPPGGLPLAAGAVVDNVATIYAISQAMESIPFTQKYLTVTGEVCRPTVLRVPVGTSFRECLALAGGPALEPFSVVAGGGAGPGGCDQDHLRHFGAAGRQRPRPGCRCGSEAHGEQGPLRVHSVQQLHAALPQTSAGPPSGASPHHAQGGHGRPASSTFGGTGDPKCPAVLRVRRV